MRTIEISTEVYARIWALRVEGEENETEILARVLSFGSREVLPMPSAVADRRLPVKNPENYVDRGPRTWSQPTWVTDIGDFLKSRGGRLRLAEIYEGVQKLRNAAGRSTPQSLQATIRRTLENHSSDSHNYTGGADLFFMPEGKGAGIWALRERYR